MRDAITPDTTVNSTEMAVVLGVTARRVRQLVQDGVLTSDNGQLPLAESVARYIAFISRDTKSAQERELDSQRKKAEVALKMSKAKKAKMEIDELEGTMHRAEDVQAFTSDLIYTIRSSLMALPGRLAMDAAAAQTPADASACIKREVYKVMRELSQYKYDPEKYADRVRDRMDWTGNGDDDEES